MEIEFVLKNRFISILAIDDIRLLLGYRKYFNIKMNFS